MKAKTLQKYQSKTLAKLKERARHYFNMFIRLRDCDENGYSSCISSGVPMQYGTSNYQAGHYYSAGHYPVTAFNENNVHAQSKSDNYFKSGNLIEYRKNLIRKIGLEKVNEELAQKGLSAEAIAKLQPIINLKGILKEKFPKLMEILKDSEIGLQGIEETMTVLHHLKDLN